MNPRVKNVLIIVGIIGAILIGALLIYGILVTPARQPYRDALAQYENVGKTNLLFTTVGANLNASGATDEEFEKAIETAEKTLTSLQTENEALSKKEVLQAGEGKELYDAFNDKLQEYITYNEDLLASMLKVRPVLFACNQDMDSITESAASIAAIRLCAAQLAALEDIPNSDYAALVTSLEEEYLSLATILEQDAALTDPQGADAARHEELQNDRDQALETLTTITSDFSKDLQQHRTVVITIDASQPLEEYLSSRSRLF